MQDTLSQICLPIEVMVSSRLPLALPRRLFLGTWAVLLSKEEERRAVELDGGWLTSQDELCKTFSTKIPPPSHLLFGIDSVNEPF
jgi:hypothetical protein